VAKGIADDDQGDATSQGQLDQLSIVEA
jgi:hypothetical protein